MELSGSNGTLIVIPAFLIGTGIVLYTGAQSLIVGLVGHRVRLFLVFGFACFCFAGFLYTSALYYTANSVEAAASALRWQGGFICVGVPLLFLFVSLYTGQSRPVGLLPVILVSGVFAIANMASPYSLRFSALQPAPPLRLPWGETLSRFSGTLSTWSILMRVAVLALLLWMSWRAAVHYREGHRRVAILLVVFVVLMVGAIVWGTLIDAGVIDSFYLAGFAFLSVVILMSVSMGIDLRDQNRALQIAAIDLRRSAAEWKQTFDNVQTPILVAHAAGTIARVNRAASQLAGIPEAAMVGTSIASLAGEPWQTGAQLVEHIAAERGGTSAETDDQHGRKWDLTIARFPDEEGRAERFILLLWDISGIVELQESLRRAEKLSAMGSLVAGVAHEVRNPLFGISATLDAYAEELNKPQTADCATALRVEVTRLKQLMQELLDYGKPTAMQVERVHLSDIVEQAIGGRMTRESDVRIENGVSAALPPLLVDRSRMRQVFENLIDNAVQHSPPRGVVRVDATMIDHAGRSWIECRVIDSGDGFSQQDVDRVFEPFFTRRNGGTGLGLSIVQRIVEEHSGNILAVNGADRGAVICVQLPVAEA